jgi:hypothetical protein
LLGLVREHLVQQPGGVTGKLGMAVVAQLGEPAVGREPRLGVDGVDVPAGTDEQHRGG